MGSDVEPAKLLLPYLQRADELQKHDPLVSYYCRLYAMEKGLKIPPKDRTKTTNSILVSLMNQLEKDKKSIKLGPDDSLHVEGFALNVFAKADKQDRAGRADLNTAKTFYAASIFFEILTQFGELQPDVEQKQKYALWKAADIRKALKEGRKPEPGPPGGEDDLSVSSSTEARSSELPRSESFPIGHPGVDISSQHVDGINLQPHLEAPTSPPSSYPSSDYSGNFHQPSLPTKHDDYSQSYHHPSHTPERQQSPPNYHSYDAAPRPSHSPEWQQPPPNYPSYDATPHPSHSPERQQPPPNYPSYDAPPENYSSQNYFSHEAHHHNYPSHETTPRSYTNENLNPPNSFPNFQSYPSFTDSTLPTAPTHNPSYHQGSDSVYSHQPPPAQNCPPPMQYTSGSGNGTHAMHTPPPAAPLPAPSYTYDSNYQPPVEKIAEAHKAARFAVGALAFDDVPVAVDFLRRSLELLTNPSAETR